MDWPVCERIDAGTSTRNRANGAEADRRCPSRVRGIAYERREGPPACPGRRGRPSRPASRDNRGAEGLDSRIGGRAFRAFRGSRAARASPASRTSSRAETTAGLRPRQRRCSATDVLVMNGKPLLSR